MVKCLARCDLRRVAANYPTKVQVLVRIYNYEVTESFLELCNSVFFTWVTLVVFKIFGIGVWYFVSLLRV